MNFDKLRQDLGLLFATIICSENVEWQALSFNECLKLCKGLIELRFKDTGLQNKALEILISKISSAEEWINAEDEVGYYCAKGLMARLWELDFSFKQLVKASYFASKHDKGYKKHLSKMAKTFDQLLMLLSNDCGTDEIFLKAIKMYHQQEQLLKIMGAGYCLSPKLERRLLKELKKFYKTPNDLVELYILTSRSPRSSLRSWHFFSEILKMECDFATWHSVYNQIPFEDNESFDADRDRIFAKMLALAATTPELVIVRELTRASEIAQNFDDWLEIFSATLPSSIFSEEKKRLQKKSFDELKKRARSYEDWQRIASRLKERSTSYCKALINEIAEEIKKTLIA